MSKSGKEIMSLYKKLLGNRIEIDELSNYKSLFSGYCKDVLAEEAFNSDELEKFLYLCLDYYAYSSNGDVLISDRDYDMCMNLYIKETGQRLIYADNTQKSWKMVNHTAPFMVGSLDKVYSFDSLIETLRMHSENHLSYTDTKVSYMISPKYDGISACIEFNDGQLLKAITRGDGIKGQDITKVVARCKNIKDLLIMYGNRGGFFKVELCVSNEDFDDVIKPNREYANRRAASSAIVNSPKNLDIAHALTAIPLLVYVNDSKKSKDFHFEYIPPYSKKIVVRDDIVRDREEVIDGINNLLKIIKSTDFPFRVDGVVLRLNDETYTMENRNLSQDAMHYAIAYKINTQSAQTQIEFAYPSIGRTGLATPMLRVKPCDVNETVVRDVSVSSFKKFNSFNFKENETITIFSAGDVIPQVDPKGFRESEKGAKQLKIVKICPYCNSKLEESYTDDEDVVNLYCRNPKCPRIVSGRITNFCTKLGAENISDGTIDKLISAKVIHDIEDLFHIAQADISILPSFGEVSASNIISEIKRLKETPTQVSKFFGALGIPNISEKKCRKVFKEFTLKKILDSSEESLQWAMYNVEGFKAKSIDTFVSFISEHKYEIKNLIDAMNIVSDNPVYGNIVFTGFRDFSLADKIAKLNYDVSESVTKQTVAVVAASLTSTKAKKASAMGIPIFLVSDQDSLLESLRQRGDSKLTV